MNTIKQALQKLDNIDIRKYIYIFPFVALFHELEEWNILEWHRAVNTGVPDVTDLHLRTFFIIVSLLQFVLIGISLIPKSRKATYYILIPVMALAMTNGIQHLIWLVQLRIYAPGVIFGFFFGVPLSSNILYRIMKERIVEQWYLIAFGGVILAGIVRTLLAGNDLDPAIRNAMLFSKSLSLFLWGE